VGLETSGGGKRSQSKKSKQAVHTLTHKVKKHTAFFFHTKNIEKQKVQIREDNQKKNKSKTKNVSLTQYA